MDQIRDAVDALLRLLLSLLNIIFAGVAQVELWLRAELTRLGVEQRLQSAILIATAVVLLVAVLRVFGGLLRVLVALFLVFLAIQLLRPIIHV
jgi:hypothetical protein